jgi:hypothetical protein
LKVVVLTTSYPRHADDTAGRFVADAVERVRRAGVDVEVVSPASFRDFGLAYGSGIVGNLRHAPWKAALLPAFMAAYARPGGPTRCSSGARTSRSLGVPRGWRGERCDARGS